MDRPFERVYTVNDFYDGPRAGVADFDGVPHAYRSLRDDDPGDSDRDERFELSPITSDDLASALEDWEIWRRWEDAFYTGLTTDKTHPALPDDRKRHEDLAPLVERALEIDPSHRRVVIGQFRSQNGDRGGVGIPTSRSTLEVRWTPIE
jgi:hypothetical protein